MPTGTRAYPPPTGGAVPPPPVEPPLVPVDEGPMRGDLRRQIAELERRLTRLVAAACPWEPRQTSPHRGPALLQAADLERIRDELVGAIDDLHRWLAERSVADVPTERLPEGRVARLRSGLRRARSRSEAGP